VDPYHVEMRFTSQCSQLFFTVVVLFCKALEPAREVIQFLWDIVILAANPPPFSCLHFGSRSRRCYVC